MNLERVWDMLEKPLRIVHSAVIATLCALSLYLIATGRSAEGYALGALSVSLIVCGYVKMIHERVVAIHRDSDAVIRGFHVALDEYRKETGE